MFSKKYSYLFIVLIVSSIAAAAQDSVRVSAADLQNLLQRIERLEQAAQLPADSPKMTNAEQPEATDIEQLSPADKAKEVGNGRHRLTIGGYGEITAKRCFYSNKYLRYVTPELYKNDGYGEFDLPHVVIYLGYDFGKGWSMGSEIEFEHGGPEVAMEIEEKEGGSEVEQEIERGGEVTLEQFWLQKRFNRYAIIRAGMQVVPVGALNAYHMPTEFFSVYRSEGEFTILPSTWHEVALTFMGSTSFGLKYQAMFLPGLDSDRFSRKNWVKTGAGSPYEFKLANVYAGALRLDYEGVRGLRLSLSGYCGNSFRNSLSNNINGDQYKGVRGTVSIGSFDFKYAGHGVLLRGNVTYGHLGDSQLITKYNSTSQVANKTRVASDAIATGMEIGYDFFSLNETLRQKKQRFYLFGRYEYYDSMMLYDGKSTPINAWCGRQRAACGLNYFPIDEVAVKAEFSYGILNKKGGTVIFNDEPAIAVGIVYAGMFKL